MKRLLAFLLGVPLFTPSAGAAANLQTAAAPAVAAPPAQLENEVFYQIFTRSMRDSNGDGEGDLKGIVQSLLYLQRLGVTSVLLTPIYPSAFYHNYFASDFEGVDPEYGSMADYRSLVRAIHARGMKLYLDEEFQYVAYDHPWFKSALNNPASPYSDFLIFHGPNNTRPEEGPFGITMAARFPGAETGITTVNMSSPKVRAWAAEYLLRWVDPNGDGDFSDGVDGFRLDHMMDDLDNKHILTNLFDSFWKPVFAQLKARNPNLHLIAEQWDWGDGGDFLRRGGVDAAFAFPLVTAIRGFDKAKIAAAIGQVENAIPSGKHELVFVENHDMQRIASDPGMTPEKLRTAATLAMLLKGTPLIYYGQELGMRGAPRPEYKSDEKDIGDREAFEWSAKTEAPGQANWYKGPKSYWTQRFARDDDRVSVAEEDADPRSLLNHYRRLLKLRASDPAFRSTAQRVIATSDSFLVIERARGSDKALIIANLSDTPGEYLVSGRDLLSGSRVNGLHLKPYQTAVIRPYR
ncbi:MAG TPA: alpha-amylase family glycosyl hydrolase [Sphingomicrobium sp.]